MTNVAVRGPVTGGNGRATALLAPVDEYVEEEEYIVAGDACRWIADDEPSAEFGGSS